MKAVLISIKPKWVEKIASGEKTIEVRKTRPKLEVPFKCYIYETKGYDTLFGKGKPKKLCVSGGRVIGEFVCDRIVGYYPYGLRGFNLSNEVLNNMCLSNKELNEYGKLDRVYGWHITDLKIYDKPKELVEFKYHCKYELDDDFKHCYGCDYHYYSNTPSSGIEEYCTCDGLKTLIRPPQSWCYVEKGE